MEIEKSIKIQTDKNALTRDLTEWENGNRKRSDPMGERWELNPRSRRKQK